MITAQQVRAGRALLNWSQKDLSTHSGISLNAINNFEREMVTPRRDTLQSLRKTLETSGLEMIGETGVNRIQEKLDVEILGTEAFVKTVTDDLIRAVKAGAGNLYMNGIDFRRFPDAALHEWMRWETAKTAHSIDERNLMVYGNFDFLSQDPVYRWVSREMLGEVAYITYGQTLVLVLWEPTPRAILIRNRAVAETFRRQFEIRWAGAKEPGPDQHVRGWEEWHGRAWSYPSESPSPEPEMEPDSHTRPMEEAAAA